MATYTITDVLFSTSPIAAQNVTIEYKIWSASSYTLVNDDVDVNTDGSLVTPEAISGLTAGEVYNIKVTNNCSSPVESYVQTVTIE